MISIDYQQTNHRNLIKNVAATMEVSVEKNSFHIPVHIGDGYFKFKSLSNGLQCLITDFKLNQAVYLSQKSTDKEFYTLRFNEAAIVDSLMVKIDKEYMWEGKQKKASILLTSSLFDFAYMGSKGTGIKSINILIPKTWFLKYLAGKHIQNPEPVLKKYLVLKTDIYNFAPFDIEYHTLFNEVFSCVNSRKPGRHAIEDHLMMMLEKFVNELAPKLTIIKEKDKIRISPDEVKRLITVKTHLIKDFSAPPPSIFCLSRVAAMSTTSLKNKFKKMYGSTLYEYFQKSRMQRAKVLMLTHKYSIKEIGCQLGYSNLSNFSIAFKKEFKRLPSHFLTNEANQNKNLFSKS